MTDTDDDKAAAKGQSSGFWLSEIAKAKKDLASYYEVCSKIRDLYREENRANTPRGFNILWSNIATIGPVTYSQVPKPVVQSRFNDGDPLSRTSCILLERNIKYMGEECGYQHVFLQSRDDFLLYARGVARVRYEPVMSQATIDETVSDAAVLGDDAAAKLDAEDAQPGEVLDFENVRLDFVNGADWIVPKCRTWEELPWMCFRSFLTVDQCVDRFGDKIGNAIPTQSEIDKKSTDGQLPQAVDGDKATIYEIWDKENQKVIWVAEGYPYILESTAPYLKFKDFWPCPRPATGTVTTDTFTPIPDYVFYQNQVEEINDLTNRIDKLSDALKVVGFYAAGPEGEGTPQIERAFQPGFENKLIAVPNYETYAKGGGSEMVTWLPVDQVAKVIKECIELRKELIQDIYQITGISDILRGQTNPNETAEAQNLKQQWGMSRMDDRRREFARFCRDCLRLVGEVICNQFQVSTMAKIANMPIPTTADVQQKAIMLWQQQAKMAQLTGQPAPPPPDPNNLGGDATPTQEQIESLLRDKALVQFRIDIETDSTVSANAQQERQDRIQFIQSATQFIEVAGQIINSQPVMAPLMGQMLLFGVRGFPVARELEEEIEKTINLFEQQVQQKASQPPQPTPEQQKAQADIQIANTKAQNDMAIDRQKAQADMQIKQVEIAAKTHAAQADMHLKNQTNQMKMQHQAQSHALKMQQAQQNAAAQAMQPQQIPTQ